MPSAKPVFSRRDSNILLVDWARWRAVYPFAYVPP